MQITSTVKRLQTGAGQAINACVNQVQNINVAALLTVVRTNRLNTWEVLRDEFHLIWDKRAKINSEAAYRDRVHKVDQAALCLSGGGIRSAAFSLGVLQVLAQQKLLAKFHYLSTVSGGGYIGAWLSRWISEDPKQDASKIEKVLGQNSETVPKEIRQVSNLRYNSNFLTPKVGLTSADTWTGIMLWVRNAILNWLVYLPALLIAVLLPNIYLAILVAMGSDVFPPLFGYPFSHSVLVIGTIVLFIGTWQATRHLPSHKMHDLTDKQVRRRVVYPALLWSALLPLVLASNELLPVKREDALPLFDFSSLLWTLFWITLAVKSGAYALAGIMADRQDRWLFLRNFPIWVATCAVASFALLFACYVIWQLAAWLPSSENMLVGEGVLSSVSGAAAPVLVLLCILGPLGVMLSHLLLTALYVAFRVPLFQDDADREWLARLSAIDVFPTLLWALFAAICLLLPWALIDNYDLNGWLAWFNDKPKWLSGGLAIVSGLIAVIGGQSPSAKLDIIASPAEKKKGLSFEAIVKIATLVFVALLFMFLARVERSLAELVAASVPGLQPWPGDLLEAHVLIFIVTALFLAVTANKIDVNRFSLHGVYRNRLVRAFLGGARQSRSPNLFTNFDAQDNKRMHQLQAQVNGKRVLYPVINVTLNLVGGENLAWQERKASSFIITPLACGCATLGPEISQHPDLPKQWAGAYVNSEFYGGGDPDLDPSGPGGKLATGISLGTAMTISGAAFSPSQGYNSSPATAFLMTMFNVRLGAWLANPAADLALKTTKAGPTNALRPLLDEALGRTSDKSKNVYLSDGGHFDNLGLYEMIRRRCRFIVVVDADADKGFAFEDLGKAVRQVVIDLDASIEFKEFELDSCRLPKKGAPTFALGEIRYGEHPKRSGWLLYIKPTYYYGTVPIDVRSYGRVNGDFPHESTLDQWFGESQFESYRRLGCFLTREIFDKAKGEAGPISSLEGLFEGLRKAKPAAPNAGPPSEPA